MCLLVGNIDTDVLKEIGLGTFYKALATLYDWLLTDENVQVNSIVFIADFSGLTLETFMAVFDRSLLTDYF